MSELNAILRSTDNSEMLRYRSTATASIWGNIAVIGKSKWFGLSKAKSLAERMLASMSPWIWRRLSAEKPRYGGRKLNPASAALRLACCPAPAAPMTQEEKAPGHRPVRCIGRQPPQSGMKDTGRFERRWHTAAVDPVLCFSGTWSSLPVRAGETSV